MAQRTVTDASGRVWTCTPASGPQKVGSDVKLSCTTAGVKEPVVITVSWAWETMANNGLARIITRAAAA